MPKIVDARGIVGAAVGPAQLLAQPMEDAIDLAQTQLFPQTVAARAHEKRRFWTFLDILMTELPVVRQGCCRTWMQW